MKKRFLNENGIFQELIKVDVKKELTGISPEVIIYDEEISVEAKKEIKEKVKAPKKTTAKKKPTKKKVVDLNEL